jgi:hypothetical protein
MTHDLRVQSKMAPSLPFILFQPQAKPKWSESICFQAESWNRGTPPISKRLNLRLARERANAFILGTEAGALCPALPKDLRPEHYIWVFESSSHFAEC